MNPQIRKGQTRGSAFDFGLFKRQIQQTASARLATASAPSAAAALAVQQLAEATLAAHRQDDSLIACGPGCGHCCIVNVAVLEPEVAAITDHIQQQYTREELAELKDQAEDLRSQVFGLDDDERMLLQRSCLFLDQEKSCRIHPVRPLLCRALTSTDADRCREAIAMAALGETPTILANLFQQQLFHQAFYGLASALEEQGRDPRSITLTEAIYQWFGAEAQRA